MLGTTTTTHVPPFDEERQIFPTLVRVWAKKLRAFYFSVMRGSAPALRGFETAREYSQIQK